MFSPASACCPQLPHSGTVEFDFVQAKRVSRRTRPLDWGQFLALALRSGLNVVLEMAAMELNERVVDTDDRVPFVFEHLESDEGLDDWDGPPEFLSALSRTPNEFPVPPYKTRYVQRSSGFNACGLHIQACACKHPRIHTHTHTLT